MISDSYGVILGALLPEALTGVSKPGEPQIHVEASRGNVRTTYFPTLYYSVTAYEGDELAWDAVESPLVSAELDLSLYVSGSLADEEIDRLSYRVHRALKSLPDITYITDDSMEYTQAVRVRCAKAFSPAMSSDVGGKSVALLSGRYSITFKEQNATRA